MADSKTIRVLFDFVSPYAYLAWRRLRLDSSLSIDPVPVLFAGLLNAHGQKGPAEVEAKRRYVFRDVVRKASAAGLAVRAPHTHPFNPLLALRVACAAENVERLSVVDALFEATWVHRLPVSSDENLRSILGTRAPQLLSDAATPAVKARLRENTDEAIEAGVFGVPTLVVGRDLFWGTDAIDFAIDASRGLLPDLRAERLAEWDNLVASATRVG